MSQLLKALVVLALLCASAALGFLVRSRMPEPQRSTELTEFIELMIVLLVTIAAVVLGLQTTSVKSAFDTAEHDRANYAAQLTLLDQCMRNYGPGYRIHSSPPAELYGRRDREQLAVGSGSTRRELSIGVELWV